MQLAEVAQEGQLHLLVSVGWLFVFEKNNLKPPKVFTRSGEMLIEMLLLFVFKRILNKQLFVVSSETRGRMQLDAFFRVENR